MNFVKKSIDYLQYKLLLISNFLFQNKRLDKLEKNLVNMTYYDSETVKCTFYVKIYISIFINCST